MHYHVCTLVGIRTLHAQHQLITISKHDSNIKYCDVLYHHLSIHIHTETLRYHDSTLLLVVFIHMQTETLRISWFDTSRSSHRHKMLHCTSVMYWSRSFATPNPSTRGQYRRYLVDLDTQFPDWLEWQLILPAGNNGGDVEFETRFLIMTRKYYLKGSH